MGNQIIDSNQVDGAILVVLPKFIGDAINTLPALELLKKLYPTQRVYVLGRPFMSHLFTRAAHYGAEFISDKRYCEEEKHSLFKMAKELKQLDISIAVLLRGSLREALLLKLAGVKNIIGYAQNARSPLLSHALKLNQSEHYIYRYCQLINIPHGRPFQQFSAPKLIPKKTTCALSKKRNVALYLGGSVKGDRHYPHDLSLELLNNLTMRDDIHLYLLGDKAEREEMETLRFKAGENGEKITNLAGSMSLDILVDTIGAMDAMISIDSGPMHIASACGTPCVAVIGQGTSPWSNVAPKRSNLIALHHNSMSLSKSLMIRDITPKAITDALTTVI
ncbi:glycosyltransferase family 9 protein [Pseudoalteromonas luteoviolacea]|uniref:glycosyltransferase family 9 protein n=1 Tax=Pseudoalteromonas luteoviolacea TaxID=43657 RepID=UPI001F193026|nr:glycosyltransferase family 9 protein [Pseudoalteromonas luteoviolacea]MCF6442387.1 glycosyltransferase family 9 protein [Pseudoalteromonas luteoviolacea]